MLVQIAFLFKFNMIQLTQNARLLCGEYVEDCSTPLWGPVTMRCKQFVVIIQLNPPRIKKPGLVTEQFHHCNTISPQHLWNVLKR